MGIKVALEALTADAARWDGTSATLSTAASAASGLYLGTELSFAADLSGLRETYIDLVSHVAGLLSQGAAETSAIADTLLDVRAAYESTDAGARDQYAGTWIPDS